MRDYTEEELKMLSDVLPNIALQLRTSLSTIYTAVDRMAPQETREKDPKTDRTAAAFYQSYYQLYRVISNLTDAGNLFERKRFELYDDDIVGVCRSVCAEVDFLFAQRGVELDFLADRDSRIIALDAEAIRKLLLNLLSNALKFTPKGGSVRVRVKRRGDLSRSPWRTRERAWTATRWPICSTALWTAGRTPCRRAAWDWAFPSASASRRAMGA